MKFPSIQSLINGLLAVIKRFPFEMVSALVGTITLIILIEDNGLSTMQEEQLVRIILASWVGLTAFLSITLYAESRSLAIGIQAVLWILCLAFCGSLYFLLDPLEEINGIRFAILITAWHLLVSFVAFIHTRETLAFWEFNKQLFIRILTSGLYSTVLFGGLCIAFISVDALFNVDIRDKFYGQLFVFISGIFNTIFFLAGVPKQFNTDTTEMTYPKGLKIFTQYVLIPLATVYLTILLLYEGKLIAEWSLPKGIVGPLVLGYGVYGILSILLVFPLRNNDENKWIKTFARWFYLLMIPLIVLLGIAIWIRIQNYGITEARYIVVILSLWLAGITAYFLISKKENIKIIPASLCIIAFLIIWGPLSASYISKQSQLNRLISYFENNNAYKDGIFQKVEAPDSIMNAESIVRHMLYRYGEDALNNHLSEALKSKINAVDSIEYKYSRSYEKARIIIDELNLEYNTITNYQYYSFGRSDDEAIHIKDYRLLREVSSYDDSTTFDATEISVTHDGTTVVFSLDSLIKTLAIGSNQDANRYTMKQHELTIYSEDSLSAFIFNDLYFSKRNDQIKIESFNGFLLLK